MVALLHYLVMMLHLNGVQMKYVVYPVDVPDVDVPEGTNVPDGLRSNDYIFSVYRV